MNTQTIINALIALNDFIKLNPDLYKTAHTIIKQDSNLVIASKITVDAMRALDKIITNVQASALPDNLAPTVMINTPIPSFEAVRVLLAEHKEIVTHRWDTLTNVSPIMAERIQLEKNILQPFMS